MRLQSLIKRTWTWTGFGLSNPWEIVELIGISSPFGVADFKVNFLDWILELYPSMTTKKLFSYTVRH